MAPHTDAQGLNWIGAREYLDLRAFVCLFCFCIDRKGRLEKQIWRYKVCLLEYKYSQNSYFSFRAIANTEVLRLRTKETQSLSL